MEKEVSHRLKVRAAGLSIVSNSLLIILKLIAGVFSGSVSIISEAIHSGMDLLASFIAFFSVRISSLPPDKKHPYGHGKFENVSGVVEAILIFIAAFWIIWEAASRLVEEKPVDNIGLGAAVMLVSGIVNFFVSRRLYKVAKKTDSVALEADALHLKTDVYTSLGVGIGLLLITLTGYHFLDPVVAIMVALFILRESWILLRKAYSPLLDTGLPEHEVRQIERIISSHLNNDSSFHQLRTRKSGNFRQVDMHLEVPGNTSVKNSHELCDAIEEDIRKNFPDTEVNIHIEPR